MASIEDLSRVQSQSEGRWLLSAGDRAPLCLGSTPRIGDDRFTSFATTFFKSRRNFLKLLRAGYEDCVINAPALAYMLRHALAGPVIAQLETHERKVFADQAAWLAHLDRLGISQLEVLRLLDPVEELAYLAMECDRLGAR